METPEKLPQSDHLVLLVGSNPLPNAVAGSLLAKKTSTITLLYSDGSIRVAQRLRKWLSNKLGSEIRLESIRVGESDPASIRSGVKDALGTAQNGSVGLHYTGGTKTMGVHAYRAIEQWAKSQKSEPATHFSYLNARTLEVIIDPNDPDSGDPACKQYVGNDVKISLAELLQLHAWSSLKNSPSDKPVLPDTAQALLALHSTRDGRSKWTTWKEKELDRLCRDDRDRSKWKAQTALSSITLQLPTHLKEVTAAINRELSTNEKLCLGPAAEECDYGKYTDKFCNWLDGEWLESALLKALNDLRTELKLYDVKMNVTPQILAGTHFQFDVIAIRGYQLFAFSCSTANDNSGDRARLKQKLFEAVIRARQMGGDEACVALVCCSEDPESLQKETRNIFLDIDDERIKVFGRRDLKDLQGNIKRWITKQSQ